MFTRTWPAICACPAGVNGWRTSAAGALITEFAEMGILAIARTSMRGIRMNTSRKMLALATVMLIGVAACGPREPAGDTGAAGTTTDTYGTGATGDMGTTGTVGTDPAMGTGTMGAGTMPMDTMGMGTTGTMPMDTMGMGTTGTGTTGTVPPTP
jgi:hypothetical protein